MYWPWWAKRASKFQHVDGNKKSSENVGERKRGRRRENTLNDDKKTKKGKRMRRKRRHRELRTVESADDQLQSVDFQRERQLKTLDLESAEGRLQHLVILRG